MKYCDALKLFLWFVTARRYASTVYAMDLSVCICLRLEFY